jgi:hypothetical protein
VVFIVAGAAAALEVLKQCLFRALKQKKENSGGGATLVYHQLRHLQFTCREAFTITY